MRYLHVHPVPQYESRCPDCQTALQPQDTLWQGIHVLIRARCPGCSGEFLEDMRIAEASGTPYQIDLKGNRILGPHRSMEWLGKPLQHSLQHPSDDSAITMQVERLRDPLPKVIVLNTVDYLYGHSLVKLLNASAHLKLDGEYSLIVLVQPFLRWMVPAGVTEIWTVNVPLSKGRSYYPALHRRISEELTRYSEVAVSTARNYPRHVAIEDYTGVYPYRLSPDPYRITFIWREDRLWWGHYFAGRVINKLRANKLLLHAQNRQIVALFSRLRRDIPEAIFTVAGLGTSTRFPNWIDDRRVERFDEDAEREACRTYAASRLVIGVHGSNMLLPSAHAGATLDLMPPERWSNFAQDIIFQTEQHLREPYYSYERMVGWRYRYHPLDISPGSLYTIARSMVKDFPRSSVMAAKR